MVGTQSGMIAYSCYTLLYLLHPFLPLSYFCWSTCISRNR